MARLGTAQANVPFALAMGSESVLKAEDQCSLVVRILLLVQALFQKRSNENKESRSSTGNCILVAVNLFQFHSTVVGRG